jgi:hypothetical protein
MLSHRSSRPSMPSPCLISMHLHTCMQGLDCNFDHHVAAVPVALAHNRTTTLIAVLGTFHSGKTYARSHLYDLHTYTTHI